MVKTTEIGLYGSDKDIPHFHKNQSKAHKLGCSPPSPQTSKSQRRAICTTSSFGNKDLALALNTIGKHTGITLLAFIAAEQKGRLFR